MLDAELSACPVYIRFTLFYFTTSTFSFDGLPNFLRYGVPLVRLIMNPLPTRFINSQQTSVNIRANYESRFILCTK